MSVSKLAEAKRLHTLGFGIHWLRTNDKIPVKPGWTSETRDTIGTLLKEYQKSYNIGTKLGKPSTVIVDNQEYYLAVIDVDVKGTLPKHKAHAQNWVASKFGEYYVEAPKTLSGRGNGSMHVWFLVPEPLDSRKLFASNEEVEVFMPSAKPTQRQIEVLGQKKVKEGWRLRPSFEIDFMCAGRQVVLPPSTHPDTGKEYKWKKPIDSISDIPIIEDMSELIEAMATDKKSKVGRPKNGSAKREFEIIDVEESELDNRLDANIVAGIYNGENVSDRSAYCLTVSLHMVRAGFSDAEILGVLTNREFFIGDVSFEHAKTTYRQRAARWAFEYCIHKARTEADAAQVFNDEIKIYDTLSPEKAKKQERSVVVRDLGQVDWRKYLDRTDKDYLKPTLKNVILILQNTISKTIFMRDSFACRDFYGCDTEWGGVKGESLTDDDTVKIKVWFANKWKIEPPVNTVFEAMVSISSGNAIHPVREYLEGLEWDGKPRVSEWLKTYLGAEAEEPYLTEVSRKFLVAAVARIYQPGVKFDLMPIFEGDQGIGKSTVGRILAGEKWFLDSLPDLTDKDAALNLQGIWICEMGELVNLKRSEVEIAKSFITRQIDKVRPPYGKRYIESYRQCVFFGSTNSEEYLKDKTGNRRYLPVKVHQLDFEALAADRDQLWAEALNIYDLGGEKLYFEDEARLQAEEAQEQRVVEDEQDTIHSTLSRWINKIKKSRKEHASQIGRALKPFRFQTSELFDDGFGVGGDSTSGPPLAKYKMDNYKLQMASNSLRKLGLVKTGINGKKWWKYVE